ncbi:hypothetical protein [Duganella sp. BJB476]|uniref:hypothetical protein n=1 Tax=Duganella sp. BJB476 TaxID=1871176 RepID=UPI0011C164AD|nr:hypothetical protein [Duganella sp. BJB476]
MWGNDSGGRDNSHLYLGLAVGAAKRANSAEDDVDRMYAALGYAYADTIAWQAISTGYQQLCEAMLDELADPAKTKDLSNPSRPEARNLFLRHAVSQAIDASTKKHQDNGNAKRWPDMLGKARSNATITAMEAVSRMDTHAYTHFQAQLRSGRIKK